MADVQIAVIDPEDTQLALAAPAEAVVNVAVPGVQGPIGTTGSVTIAQAGTAATPGIRFESDPNTGIYSPGADQLAISTGGTGRLFVDASGRVGIGTSSPQALLHLSSSTITESFYTATGTGGRTYRVGTGDNTAGLSGGFRIYDETGAATRLFINSSGNVGVGTTSPGSALEINAAAATSPFIAKINTAEAARLDSSGRLLVGTSTSLGTSAFDAYSFQFAGTTDPTSSAGLFRFQNNTASSNITFTKSRGASTGTITIVNDGDSLGLLNFRGADGTGYIQGATISAQVDGTPGTNDMPGRLVFSTTADGAASPTERLRITSAGVLQIAEAGNIQVGTTTGTKIGTATTQKIGFYNATPVVQPTAVADATDAASVITQLNALLTRMRNLGLIAA